MAKKGKVVESAVNRELLAAIASGQVTHVNHAQAMEAGLGLQPALIDCAPVDPATGTAQVRINEAGAAYLANGNAAPVAESASNYELISGIELPASKRGAGLRGGGAPTKYPFEKMEVGQSFFVPVSAKHPDPVKTLGSTVSSAKLRFAEVVGQKSVTRAKRGKGNKLELDAAGNKIMETKQVDVRKFTRNFEIRPVEAGKSYGGWTAPANGAVIARTA